MQGRFVFSQIFATLSVLAALTYERAKIAKELVLPYGSKSERCFAGYSPSDE
jgi:hypothetical protein